MYIGFLKLHCPLLLTQISWHSLNDDTSALISATEV